MEFAWWCDGKRRITLGWSGKSSIELIKEGKL